MQAYPPPNHCNVLGSSMALWTLGKEGGRLQCGTDELSINFSHPRRCNATLWGPLSCQSSPGPEALGEILPVNANLRYGDNPCPLWSPSQRPPTALHQASSDTHAGSRPRAAPRSRPAAHSSGSHPRRQRNNDRCGETEPLQAFPAHSLTRRPPMQAVLVLITLSPPRGDSSMLIPACSGSTPTTRLGQLRPGNERGPTYGTWETAWLSRIQDRRTPSFSSVLFKAADVDMKGGAAAWCRRTQHIQVVSRWVRRCLDIGPNARRRIG